jgi:hypothetical protein
MHRPASTAAPWLGRQVLGIPFLMRAYFTLRRPLDEPQLFVKACSEQKLISGYGAPRMIDYRHTELGSLPPAGNDLMTPEQRGDQSALSTVLWAGNMTHPAAASTLYSACKWILIPAEDTRDLAGSTLILEVHGGLSLSTPNAQVGTAIRQHCRVTCHLSMPYVVRKPRMGTPIYPEFRVYHHSLPHMLGLLRALRKNSQEDAAWTTRTYTSGPVEANSGSSGEPCKRSEANAEEARGLGSPRVPGLRSLTPKLRSAGQNKS